MSEYFNQLYHDSGNSGYKSDCSSDDKETYGGKAVEIDDKGYDSIDKKYD